MTRVVLNFPDVFGKIFNDVIKHSPKYEPHKPRVKILIDKPANQLRAYITFEDGIDLEEMCVQVRAELDPISKTKPKEKPSVSPDTLAQKEKDDIKK